MTLAKLRQRIYSHTAALGALVLEHVEKGGDTEESSQQLVLLNRLRKVDFAANGLAESDMVKPKKQR